MSWSIAPGSEPMEAPLPTADIIPFPARPKASEPSPSELGPSELSPSELGPGDRLSRAMESLNAALAEQRVALAAWREALGQLKSTTAGLGESLQHYHSNLGALSDRVSGLNAQARTLERWADGVISN